MHLVKEPREALLTSLQSAINSELKRAISILEYPAPLPNADHIRKFVHVRSSERGGKPISKFYWRNRLVLTMNDPRFENGGNILEVKFVRFLECSRIVATKFEYLPDERKVRKIGGRVATNCDLTA